MQSSTKINPLHQYSNSSVSRQRFPSVSAVRHASVRMSCDSSHPYPRYINFAHVHSTPEFPLKHLLSCSDNSSSWPFGKVVGVHVRLSSFAAPHDRHDAWNLLAHCRIVSQIASVHLRWTLRCIFIARPHEHIQLRKDPLQC